MTSPKFLVSSSLIILLLGASKGFAADASDLGISVEYTTQSFGGAQEHGFVVMNVYPGSPAERAGLRARTTSTKMGDLGAVDEPGDLIVAVNDRRMRGEGDFNAALGHLKPGDKMYLAVIRDDGKLQKMMRLAVTVGAVAAPADGFTH